MKPIVYLGAALVSSMMLSACFTSVYAINRLENGSLPETQRNLNAWARTNPNAHRSASLQVSIEGKAPFGLQALPLQLDYVADNCGFKGRSVEGLLEAYYPHQRVNIPVSAATHQTYHYVYQPDAFLPQTDGHGRTCVWRVTHAQVQLKAINPANKSVANIQFSLFDKDLTQTQTLVKYFGRQVEGDQFPNITLKSAQAQPEQAFRVMVRHQPKND